MKDAQRRDGSGGELKVNGRRGEFRRQPAKRVLRRLRGASASPTSMGADPGTGDPDQKIVTASIDVPGADPGTGDPDRQVPASSIDAPGADPGTGDPDNKVITR